MKKTGFILLLMLLIVSVFAFVNYYRKNFTGSTTSSYVLADSVLTKNIDDISVVVYNGGAATNAVTYKLVEYYGSWDGVTYEASEDSLTVGEVYLYTSEKPMYGIRVFVKSTVTDSVASYTGYFNFNK